MWGVGGAQGQNNGLKLGLQWEEQNGMAALLMLAEVLSANRKCSRIQDIIIIEPVMTA